MSKRQASIATFLSPRQTATSSVKRAAVDASADSPAKRARRAAIRAAAEVKREDSPNVELTGGAGGSPETKSSPASTADKGKGKAVELDLSLYNGDMKPEEAEMLAIAESVKNARATAGRNVEAADTKKDIIELDDLDTESKPGESSRSPLLSPVVKPSPTPIAKIKAGQSGTTPSHLPFTFPPPDHPSYHLPPSPTYNHPITIVPPSASLVDAMRFNTVPRSITSPADLDLLYFTKFIDPTCSRLLTKYLLDSLPWYRVNYTTKGIDIKTPRYTTVFGKDATAMPWEVYDKWKPRAIPEILLRLMQKVEEVTGETYNFTLVNYYSSGTDSISYHSDSERFLGSNPCIASISLGAPRDFMLRHVDYRTNGIPVQKFNLHDGDMVVMRGKTQHKYQHAIPKRAKAEGRINITFRKGVVKYATENYLTYNVGRGPMFRWKGGKMVQQDES